MHEYDLRDESELKALNVMWRDAFLNKTENELHENFSSQVKSSQFVSGEFKVWSTFILIPSDEIIFI